eukprot:652856-Pleurochrysis_carterae.AAC.1
MITNVPHPSSDSPHSKQHECRVYVAESTSAVAVSGEEREPALSLPRAVERVLRFEPVVDLVVALRHLRCAARLGRAVVVKRLARL